MATSCLRAYNVFQSKVEREREGYIHIHVYAHVGTYTSAHMSIYILSLSMCIHIYIYRVTSMFEDSQTSRSAGPSERLDQLEVAEGPVWESSL